MLIERIADHAVDERSLSCCHLANETDLDQQINPRIAVFDELNDGLIHDPAILIKRFLTLRAILRDDSTQFAYSMVAFGDDRSSLGFIVAELALPTVHL